MSKKKNELIPLQDNQVIDLSSPQEPEKKKKSFFGESVLDFFDTIFSLAFLFEIIKTLVICLAIVLPIRYFLIQPFYVVGASMEPNFYDHEYLIVDELSYRLRSPERGEVIVFKYPLDTRQFFIKRIIGLPGERIKISNGAISIFNQEYPNGKILDENKYLPAGLKTLKDIDVTLKENEYYVLGDNRNRSKDSTDFGPIDKKLIIGKALIRGWPIDRINYFEAPEYSF